MYFEDTSEKWSKGEKIHSHPKTTIVNIFGSLWAKKEKKPTFPGTHTRTMKEGRKKQIQMWFSDLKSSVDICTN